MTPASIADLVWALAATGPPPAREPAPGRIQAAVGVPLHQGPRGLEVWAIKRSAGMRQHAGELAFPGGRPEPGDGGLPETAVRECVEELGIARRRFRVLGPLTPVPALTSLYTLHPFAMVVGRGAAARPSAAEVAALIRAPLGDFFGGRIPYRAVRWGGYLSPIFDFDSGSMYGASAHVLEELLARYAEASGVRMPEPRLTAHIPWA